MRRDVRVPLGPGEEVIIDSLAVAFHCRWEKDGVKHGYVRAGPHLVQASEMPERLYAVTLAAAKKAARKLPPPWEK